MDEVSDESVLEETSTNGLRAFFCVLLDLSPFLNKIRISNVESLHYFLYPTVHLYLVQHAYLTNTEINK